MESRATAGKGAFGEACFGVFQSAACAFGIVMDAGTAMAGLVATTPGTAVFAAPFEACCILHGLFLWGEHRPADATDKLGAWKLP
jgi:hypothetical protein